MPDLDCRRSVSKLADVPTCACSYNKVEKDFATLREYNDYLEEVEDISEQYHDLKTISGGLSSEKNRVTVFSIVNEEPNAEEMKAKVKSYEAKNRSAIVVRQSQRDDEERCILDRIAAEERERGRRKREFSEIEKAVTAAKRKFKKESTEVMLGERDQVSAEVQAAQMQGYRNELMRQQRGRGGQVVGDGPRVREPEGGLREDRLRDREMYRKRQAAGGGITSENIAVHDRNWQMTVASTIIKPRRVTC